MSHHSISCRAKQPASRCKSELVVIGFLRQWIEHRRAIRRRWRADARQLAATDPVGAYYEAQRRAAGSQAQGNAVNTGIGPRLPAKSPASNRVPRWTSRSSRRLPIRNVPVAAEHMPGAWRKTCLVDAVAVVQVKACAEHHLALQSKPIPLFIDGPDLRRSTLGVG